ncbi:hypothetical protein, partial [Klebsiella pneumoniae]
MDGKFIDANAKKNADGTTDWAIAISPARSDFNAMPTIREAATFTTDCNGRPLPESFRTGGSDLFYSAT